LSGWWYFNADCFCFSYKDDYEESEASFTTQDYDRLYTAVATRQSQNAPQLHTANGSLHTVPQQAVVTNNMPKAKNPRDSRMTLEELVASSSSTMEATALSPHDHPTAARRSALNNEILARGTSQTPSASTSSKSPVTQVDVSLRRQNGSLGFDVRVSKRVKKITSARDCIGLRYKMYSQIILMAIDMCREV
jgi:hypothetical protein